MTTTAQGITAILKKAGIAFQPLPKDWNSSNLDQIFRYMVPERICEFDPACIVEPVDYVGILAAFAQATLGEFAPENPRAEGRTGGSILLEFVHAEQVIRFKFKQDGRWVADAFYVQLRKFCKKHLTGNYLSVDTNVSTDVYLPHKVISQIEKKTRAFDDVDTLLQFVLSGASGGDLLRARDRLSWQVKAGYTRSGESLLTALAKSDAETDTFMCAFETFDFPYLPNRYGESVWELAQRFRGLDLKRQYHSEDEKTLGYAEIREMWGERLWHNNLPEYMQVINALDPDLASMRFPVGGNLFDIALCHTPVFDLWSDAAELSYSRPDKVYIVHLLTLGPDGGALYQEIPVDRVDMVIDLLRRYCRRTLWTAPGQDGAWLVTQE
ncbi:hypothetical protein [Pseudomonas indica]|uniref:hypothetical protein n=1 Tax=Pseudomonas indica TaxID=137658 RepID=UPI0023F6CA4B|nr:hypothetical protein [Pseudomonas indica]MBU3059429.1 hypothetical protein [Pseudomonas indica]